MHDNALGEVRKVVVHDGHRGPKEIGVGPEFLNWLTGACPSWSGSSTLVCTRFVTYDVELDPVCAAYRDRIIDLPQMREWKAEALKEPDEVEELEVEF